ncbi:MAG: DUF2620 family protein [Erysipelotrichaceae bacterium]|nr:DUF2620 family protein [Erysipelotrichaceae bacterium]
MLKIACCGLAATRMKMIIEKNFSKEEVEVLTLPDTQAVRKVKSGEADYFFGTCHTGGGGSLATAIAILGYSNCLVLSRYGYCPKETEVKEKVAGGNHKAFGMVEGHVDKLIIPLVKALLEKNK